MSCSYSEYKSSISESPHFTDKNYLIQHPVVSAVIWFLELSALTNRGTILEYKCISKEDILVSVVQYPEF